MSMGGLKNLKDWLKYNVTSPTNDIDDVFVLRMSTEIREKWHDRMKKERTKGIIKLLYWKSAQRLTYRT